MSIELAWRNFDQAQTRRTEQADASNLQLRTPSPRSEADYNFGV